MYLYPHIYYNPEYGWFVLAKDYYYKDWKIERGFTYDLASIRRPFRVFISNHELGLKGPLVHDFLYRTKGLPYREVTRKEADKIFLQIMKEDNIPKWKRLVAYGAVRAFGWKAWNTQRTLQSNRKHG